MKSAVEEALRYESSNQLGNRAVTAETTNAVARFMIHLNEIDSTTYTGLYELK